MTFTYRRLRRICRPLAETAREVSFLAAIRRGEYRPPPGFIKVRILKKYVPASPKVVFVETGTYFGDIVAEMKGVCRRVISIELDRELYELARKRFKNEPNVELTHGDCVVELPKVLARITEPAVFWLDAHWSAGVTARGGIDDPIMDCLEQIKSHPIKSHILLIDDATTFNGVGSQPDLVDVLSLVKSINKAYQIRVHGDIITAVPAIAQI